MVQPNVLDRNCGSRQVLNLLADRWSVLTIYALRGQTLRYGELHSARGDISQKMLTQTLQRLERSCLVARHAYPEIPSRVEYALTELGVSVLEPLGALCRWAEVNMAEVMVERSRYDAAD